MISELFQKWLHKPNSKLKPDIISILLFIDNFTTHPDVQFNNVCLVFPPLNTTSKLPPCNAGIIQATEVDHKKLLLRHELFHMDDAAYAPDLAKV